MAQYDVLLQQNVHATLTEYTERFVAGARSNLITFNSSAQPVALSPGTSGQVLKSAGAAGDLYWDDLSAGHTQNTDTGTDSTVFELDNDGYQIELTAESATKFGVYQNGGVTYADFEAKDATFNKVTVVNAPSAGSDLTNKTYVDGILGANDAMVFKGVIDCSTNPNYPAADAGDTYKVSVAGKIGGASGPNVEVGDTLYCINDSTASGDHATVGANWVILQVNLDGAVIGPSGSVTDDNIVTWDGTSGALIQDSGYAISDLLLLSTFTAGGQILYSTGSAAVAVLASGTSGDYLTSGGTGAPSWTTPGTMIGEDASDYVAKALFDANTILAANTDDTPAAVTVAEDRIVGRISGGNIAALTGVQVMNVIWSSAPASASSTGTAGEIAYDEDYIYVCVATDTWVRAALATNWT
jgi:hypothetical protein